MIDKKRGTLLETFFLSVGNQKKLFYNFNTSPHGATFNHIFEKKITLVLLPAYLPINLSQKPYENFFKY
jgi:hypothetical protein